MSQTCKNDPGPPSRLEISPTCIFDPDYPYHYLLPSSETKIQDGCHSMDNLVGSVLVLWFCIDQQVMVSGFVLFLSCYVLFVS